MPQLYAAGIRSGKEKAARANAQKGRNMKIQRMKTNRIVNPLGF